MAKQQSSLEKMGLEKSVLTGAALSELIIRILCDVQPVYPSDGAYLYCQTESNQLSLFQTALSLLSNSHKTKIFILQAGPKNGYPGFQKWQHELHKMRLPIESVDGIKIDEAVPLNTLTESEALISFAKLKGYRSLFVVAPPFHQLRAFMTAITVVLREYPALKLYSHPAFTMPWQEEAVHSQGTLKATRSELIHMELERINMYQKKGDLASFDEILTYLNNRR